MAKRIDTVKARDSLEPRTEPYWTRISAGCQLGFRKMTAASAGTWIAKFRDANDGRREKRTLGAFDTLPPAQRFDAAKVEAEKLFKHLASGGKAEVKTVKEACASYVTHLRANSREKAAKDVERRFKQYVNDTALAKVELQKLKPGDIDSWRKTLAGTMAAPQDKDQAPTRQRSASTLNRDMTPLRAALNLAMDDEHVTTDAAWRSKLRPLKNADQRRDTYLNLTERRALIAAAPADLAAFLSALSLVPLRPGAMAALVAGNYDKHSGTLTIGSDKAGGGRKITLPKLTAAFFAKHAKDKLPAAPLLARADGKAWDKDAWKGPVVAAVVAAGLNPKATAYALRHSVITDLCALHKLDTMTVAQLSGTSLQMIEKHYGHLLQEHAKAALASLKL